MGPGDFLAGRMHRDMFRLSLLYKVTSSYPNRSKGAACRLQPALQPQEKGTQGFQTPNHCSHNPTASYCQDKQHRVWSGRDLHAPPGQQLSPNTIIMLICCCDNVWQTQAMHRVTLAWLSLSL